MKRTILMMITASLMILGYAGSAFAAPSDLDSSFDGDGMVTTSFSSASNSDVEGVRDHIGALALQPDGKVIAAGYAGQYNCSTCAPDNVSGKFALARYNLNGGLDTSFGSGTGKVVNAGLIGRISDLVVQPDGKIVATGELGASKTGVLTRYNSDGSFDTSFDGDGKVQVFADLNGENSLNALALQPDDGKIVVAGESGGRFAVARYNPNGTPDTSFDADGFVSTPIGPQGLGSAADLALQPDGKIVAAGTAFVTSNSGDFAVARYNPNGSLDGTFGGGGKVTTDLGTNTDDQANALALQSNGKIVAGGDVYLSGNGYDFAWVRYNPNGSLDNTFDGNGKKSWDFWSDADSINDLIVKPNGKIVAAGSARGSWYDSFVMVGLNADGSDDTSFAGTKAYRVTNFSGGDPTKLGNQTADALLLQPDGKMVAAGSAGPSNFNGSFALARYVGDVANTAPSITPLAPRPASTIKDRTPLIKATVVDKETDLAKSNIKLFLDGQQIMMTFNYYRSTDTLSYTPSSNLALGKHTVKVVAKDAQGLSTARSWSFTIAQ